ncbi:hypothetical protein ACWDPG_34935, partial [Nocardia sp. NPDC003648]
MTDSDWRAIAAATGPGDRAAAEAGVRLAYSRAGLPEPEQIRWAPRPRVRPRRAVPRRTCSPRPRPRARR